MKYLSDLKELEGQKFESIADLEVAEAKVNKAIAEKKKAAETRKIDAEKVKEAIINRVEAERTATKEKKELYKKYLADLEKIDNAVEAKYEVEQKALTDFCSKHPEGFHDTVVIDDVTYRYNYSTKVNTAPKTLFDLFFGD